MKVNSKEDWDLLVEKLRASGLTKTEFCKRNDISLGKFYELVKLYGDGIIPVVPASKPSQSSKVKSHETKSASFIELELDKPNKIELETSPKKLRIVTSYGAVIEVPL